MACRKETSTNATCSIIIDRARGAILRGPSFERCGLCHSKSPPDDLVSSATEVVMRQLYLFAATSALIAGFLFSPASTRAETLSCSSVNGVTHCIGSDGLDCHTIDGHMVCEPEAKGHCETVSGVTTCTNGNIRQSFRTDWRNPTQQNDDEEK